MAPISGSDNSFSPRETKPYEVNMEKEMFIAKFLLGFFAVVVGTIVAYCLWLDIKPKYKEIWKPKLKRRLQDYEEKYEECKKKLGAWHGPKEPAVPAPAHVVDRDAPQVSEADRITTNMTPEYLKKTTAVMFPAV
ncbi:hypothetical protein N7457_008793 [Penicillium paradoxum]|uniref:uncharacterized protein n=1 Tax=Penicillium paradoxum TaxID=176176 RepID=UPI00254663D2|nr:uncharacterized protein N7457_008793 [Penicillium paradoxum]KAJ5773897.1 hypothetical protein N7457_008793 [Penicillium paradoxum]